MAKNENSDIVLNESIASWQLNANGTVKGTYIGTFKFRCLLSPTQRIAADREYRDLLGPNMSFAPEEERFLAYALTQLKYRILSAPPFWTATLQESAMAGDIPDENIIGKVLDAAMRSEFKYREQFKERTEMAVKRSKKKAEKIKEESELEKDEGDAEET